MHGGNRLRALRDALVTLLLVLAASPIARACGPDALGTARTLSLDTSGGPQFGLKQYARTLPLGDREVVLTFDDGPHHGVTPRVLDALARECVKATFFLIGRNAAALPGLTARIARDGHTLANHTFSHPWTIDRLSHAAALADLDRGEDAIRMASGARVARFVRFPGFVETPALLSEMTRRNVAVFGTDVWASDWNVMAPDVQLRLVLGRIERARRGIVLFHDIKDQTAAMLPAFLRELKRRGFRVVHVTG